MSGKIFFTGIIVLFGLLLSVEMAGQDWYSARLSLLYGGSIPFNFNSMKAYSEGIEIEEGTILGITLSDSAVVGHDLEGFELTFKTFNGQTDIVGSAHDLPLNVIRVKAENNFGLGSGTSAGYMDLNTTSTLLFSYIDIPFSSDLKWDTHQLALSYECGKPDVDGNGSLLGRPPDYYTVEIEIELLPVGAGF